ncbi:putative sensory transduction regulator [Stackebrandtia endophytica]|uniref:Putative sensory transduction regulator n=1 Tax=Stackebrandtia endophytica TaxID=1496996 RepID=A0A543B1V2_9ACTN|nr:YbjN domain-containing protein [Stackebrandtia endophytica]TQL78796.1 putative sensory transduction regulator [Stackebrandtia endophytica]
MAWWWKRNARAAEQPEQASELDVPRPTQSSPIPAPRPATDSHDLDDPMDRWDIIKQDLVELDPDFFSDLDQLMDSERHANEVDELSDERLTESLRRLSVRYLVDEAGALLAMWERHVVQIRREGPSGEILVLRARAYATLPAEWEDQGLRAVNEWNRTRRFLKAYIGEPTETGRLPLYGETQIPLRPGITDALLDELIDCAAAVSGAYVDWLHDEGAVL